MEARKPVWRTSSYLVYTGGLTVLGGAIAALAYLSSHDGRGAVTGWALLVLVVLYGLAHALRRRGRWVAAGIFGFVSVIAWAILVALAWHWFGWLDHWGSAFGGFSVAHLSLELLVLLAAIDDRRRFDFPFISLISTLAGWFFVTDLVSNGGGWSYVVTLLVGLAYLVAGIAVRSPSAFWLELVAGVLIGASLLHWWHTTDVDWALVSAASLVYVALGYATRRSSWAVLGSIGFFGATLHYLFGSITAGLPFQGSSFGGWEPAVAFACLGFWLVLLGLLGRRRAA